MEKFVVQGGYPLKGEIKLQGAKNVALKMFVASLLTEEELILHNVPKIRDVYGMLEILNELGVVTTWEDHSVRLHFKANGVTTVPLDVGARLRTSSLVLGPLLLQYGKADIPNPGGCRLGVRPIDRHIKAIGDMGAKITYDSSDGFFHATSEKLIATTVQFDKVTHTGTEAVILAAVKAQGTTIINNAAQEIEIDDLIQLLNNMGGKISRTKPDQITVQGVQELHGTEYTIMPDRNEEVTWAIAAVVTGGEITVIDSERQYLTAFLEPFKKAGGQVIEHDKRTTTYKATLPLKPIDIETSPHPGFMTDWQAPWALLMTQAQGVSTVHETVFESRFSYVSHLQKMGASIEFYEPAVANPHTVYNFNWEDRIDGTFQGIRIIGPSKLHNAVAEIDDIRAGATLLIASLAAQGESYIYSPQTVDRGYEEIEVRLRQLGAKIIREKEDV